MTNSALEKLAPKSGEEAAETLLKLVREGKPDYFRKCLMVQRGPLRGIPAVYPTALSASNAVPENERVPFEDARRGMVGFSYDPSIPGTSGHVFFINGRDRFGRIITGTNDAKSPVGCMSYVPLHFYADVWGHKLQFAATNLNGYDFADFNKPPKPVLAPGGGLGDHYVEALRILIKVYHRKKDKFGPSHPLVKALHRDCERMRRRIARFDGSKND